MTKKFEENLATSSADSVAKDLFCEMDWGNSEFLESVQPAAINLSELFSSGKTSNAESPYSWMIGGKVSPDAIDSGDRWRVNLNVQSQVAEVADEVVKAVQDYSLNSTCVSEAYLVLAASYSVRKLVGKSDFVQWQGTVDRLFDISKAIESNSEISMEAYQWLAIELPLVVSCQFPEWDGRQFWALEAIRKMGLSISELLDHDGWPTTRCLPSFGVLAASWVRCQLIVDAMKDKSVLTHDTGLDVVSQLEWMVRQVIRMMRFDRKLVFSGHDSSVASKAFLRCLLKLSSDRDDKLLLKQGRGKAEKTSGESGSANALGIDASNVSEWSESALMRSDWSRNSPRLAVNFSNGKIFSELSRKSGLISGETTPEILADGKPLSSSAAFEISCTQSDEAIEYLELEKKLDGGGLLTRQFLLSNVDRFLLIADAVVIPAEAELGYRCSFPFAKEIEGLRESETTEMYLLKKGKIQSLVLPLALPEWKVARTKHSFEIVGDAIKLTQNCHGSGLYAPLFFDLDPKRSCKKRTWRSLTVAENLNRIRSDDGAAFRVHLNKQQWFFYRSLATKGNRTFFGENFTGEFLFSQFSKNGSVERLMEIE
ncbi:MAG: hypothetical protein GY880_24165 [Planctomycetaceae bacterium]|nr:hypothetical protein [Planctomycetaceae bacterium]